jgi:membrane fusion protein (multidrug efflux system)
MQSTQTLPLLGTADETSKRTRTARTSRAKLVLPAVAAILAVAGGIGLLTGAGKETTDDAFLEAHVANVATRIPGQVRAVLVADNQEVNQGDVLVALDDRDVNARLATARADLASATATLTASEATLALTERNIEATLRQARGGVSQAVALAGSSKATIDQALADITAAESRRALAEIERTRSEKLFADGAIGKADLDMRVSAYEQAVATLEQAKARKAGALTGIGNAAGTIETAEGRLAAAQTGPEQVSVARAQVAVAHGRVDQARAALDQAELNVEYTKIRAPIHGVVSRRTVEPGQMVDPARTLLSLTNLDDVWVVANFKEDQLAHMRAGQPVRLRVDTYGRKTFDARVDSIAGGTGSRFALLPPDNASGNFTKVVQRVPVLVRFDEKPGAVLRPGMSASVTVVTGGS